MNLPPPPAGWSDLPFFRTDWRLVQDLLQAETRPWLPGPDRLFAALALPPERVRVVILGQDPYPNATHAMGLAFSVPPGLRPLPRSLNNIFKELAEDLDVNRTEGDLTGWRDQGVLLLNPVLSVPEGESNGHRSIGWQALARQIITRLDQQPRAWILWGNPARDLARPLIGGDGHLVLTSAHPSPLSARRGFFGSRPFSRVNDWLAGRGETPIDWAS